MNNDLKINSVDEYIKVVLEKTATHQKEEDSGIFWFRGESSVQWKTPIVPNSYRVLAETFKDIIDDLFVSENIKQLEKRISAEFLRKALPYISSKRIDNSAWNRYFLMQHYKINTRLLDWTENAMLALFFAICDKSTIEDDAKVWILQPLNLNNYTINTILNSVNQYKVIPYGSDSDTPQNLMNSEGLLRINELTRRYLRMDFEEKEKKDSANVYFPLAIYPTFLDERMTAQKACFTIFGNKINGLFTTENCKDNFIDSITISGGKRKTEMLEQLRILGVDFESIYPDLDGLGSSINNKYKNKFTDNRETLIHAFNSITKKKN